MKSLPMLGWNVFWAFGHQGSEKGQSVSHVLYSFLKVVPKNYPEFPTILSALIPRVRKFDHLNSPGAIHKETGLH